MRHSSDIALVPIRGDLSSRTVPYVRDELEGLINGGTRRIVLNMADVPYVDSSGMSLIFVMVRRMRECGGLISFVNVCPNVMHTMRIARVVDLVPVSAASSPGDVPELDSSAMPLWRTTLPVNASNLLPARHRVAELARQLPFTGDQVFDITLAVGEALGNAADHTCGEGVLATVSAYPDRMIVEVTDCGDGIDSTTPEAENPERGRGIMLMRLLVDSVCIERRAGGSGTLVRLVKLTR